MNLNAKKMKNFWKFFSLKTESYLNKHFQEIKNLIILLPDLLTLNFDHDLLTLRTDAIRNWSRLYNLQFWATNYSRVLCAELWQNLMMFVIVQNLFALTQLLAESWSTVSISIICATFCNSYN